MSVDNWLEFDEGQEMPPDLSGVRYRDTDGAGEDVEFTEDDFVDYEDDAAPGSGFVEDELDPPSSMEVVSQTVRTGPDGNQVVDVVIDVEDIDGAINYEFRITKA